MINLVCLPSQERISQSYRFGPPAQVEDLDAYLMFIFDRSHLRGPTCNAGSLKRRQSLRGIKQAHHRSREIDGFYLMKPKQRTLPLLAIIRPDCLAFNIKVCKRCATLINQDSVGEEKTERTWLQMKES